MEVVMSSNEVILTEAKALKHLAEEAWNRAGKYLVSRDGFMPEAAQQYIEPLSRRTKDALKLRVQAHPLTEPGAKQLVLDARSAEKFMSKHGLSLNEVPVAKDGLAI